VQRSQEGCGRDGLKGRADLTDKPKVRGGIVGSGFAANLHYEGIQRVYGTDVDLVGIYSPTEANARRFAESRRLRAFPSLEALLDQVEVVHVCASPAAHEAIAVSALERGVHAVVEKPLTGWFGDGTVDFHVSGASMQRALDGALVSIDRMLDAEAKSKAMILYAENWVYAPAIQKEREIIEKTGAQVLWIHGEESHSGSHSKAYGVWRLNGGGALIGKAVHPLTAALYLKRVEGRARSSKPIQPAAVSARTHSVTRLDGFVDRGFLRTDYHDVEDFSATHVVFEDGTIADIFASEIVMGGIHNCLEVMANNHRTVCNINPNTAMQTYNPAEDQFRDIYVVEKIGTKQGWAPTAPDEDFITGFPQEIEAFYRAAATGEPPESDGRLAADCISTVYSAYLSAERKGAEVAVRAY
jgi:predicted dehydrogenase